MGKPSAERFPRCCVYCFLLWSCDSSICLHFCPHCLLTTLPNSPFFVYIHKDRWLALWEKEQHYCFDLPIREDYILLSVLLILGVSWTPPPANKADWLSFCHRTSLSLVLLSFNSKDSVCHIPTNRPQVLGRK